MEKGPLGCLCHQVDAVDGLVFEVELRQLQQQFPGGPPEGPPWGAPEGPPGAPPGAPRDPGGPQEPWVYPGNLQCAQEYPGDPQGHFGGPQGYWGAPQGYTGGPQEDVGGPQGHLWGPPGGSGAPQGYWGGPQGYSGGPQEDLGGPQGYWGGPQGYWGAPQGLLDERLGVETAGGCWKEEKFVVGWQQKVFSQMERGVYMQPLDVEEQQMCPRWVFYQQQLLQEFKRDKKETLFPGDKKQSSFYTFTDGDIRETLPFLLLRAQQKGAKHPARPPRSSVCCVAGYHCENSDCEGLQVALHEGQFGRQRSQTWRGRGKHPRVGEQFVDFAVQHFALL
ncbi:hypothetical protein, conserved [Eimeria necatrix]|uniref:Uncharacterized protein n=1 Tax=Eimeria necatrix TaxID=51315 RepID=U6N8I6_9EIME|nr:hypothetical protein, conserved [Eimeria necatrix]CDJ70176.1 hypothetical protein, conserved [Eimeria necatrix]